MSPWELAAVLGEALVALPLLWLLARQLDRIISRVRQVHAPPDAAPLRWVMGQLDRLEQRHAREADPRTEDMRDWDSRFREATGKNVDGVVCYGHRPRMPRKELAREHAETCQQGRPPAARGYTWSERRPGLWVRDG